MLPFRTIIFIFAILSGFITSYSVLADAQEAFDRLDGKGPSGKKVDVIEWEGNIELHTFPKGKFKGFGAKLDNRTKGKDVMVIEYHFEGSEVLTRRAILGVPFKAEGLKAYIDPTEKDFDKHAITNQNLGKPWVPYPMKQAPKNWYPEGDERNQEESKAPMIIGKKTIPARDPASVRDESKNESTDAPTAEKIPHFSW